MNFEGFKLRRTKEYSLTHITAKSTTYSKLVWPSVKDNVLKLDYYQLGWASRGLHFLYTIEIHKDKKWFLNGVKQTKKPSISQLKAHTIHKNDKGYYLDMRRIPLCSSVISDFLDSISSGYWWSIYNIQKLLTRPKKDSFLPEEYRVDLVITSRWTPTVTEYQGNIYIQNGGHVCCITKDNRVFNYNQCTYKLTIPVELRINSNLTSKLGNANDVYTRVHNKNIHNLLFCFKHKLENIICVSYLFNKLQKLSLNKLRYLNVYGDSYYIRRLLNTVPIEYLVSIDEVKFKNLFIMFKVGFPHFTEGYKNYLKYLSYTLSYDDQLTYRNKQQYLCSCADYIRMHNRFPTKLPKYPDPALIRTLHDALMADYNKFLSKEREIQEQELAKNYIGLKKDLEKLNFENSNFIVFAPNDVRELNMEGMVLHHCVGSYIRRVCTKGTRIYFLRKKNDVNSPYFTVEVDYSNTIRQCHTYCNKTINKVEEYNDLLSFLQEWCSSKNLKMESKDGIM
jgi:hypothetical protein